MNDFWSQPVDQQALMLTRAIALQEGGGKPDYSSGLPNGTPSGAAKEMGAYQWLPGNFEANAREAGLDPTDTSAQNQDKVAYFKIKQYKDQGYTPPQIASMWNAGPDSPDSYLPGTIQKKGNTPKYAQGVFNYYQQLSGQGQQDQGGTGQSGAPPAPSGGGFLGAVGGLAKGFIQGQVDDFKNAAGFFNGKAYQSINNFGTAFGGLANSAMDIGILLGSLAINAPDVESGALPTDVAGIEAKNLAERGILTAIRSSKPMQVLGKLASAQGGAKAAMTAVSGAAAGAQAIGQGKGAGEAAQSALEAAGSTYLTLSALNWAGPKLNNLFLRSISGMSFAKDFVSTKVKQVVDALQSASASMKSSEGAGGALADELSHAANASMQATSGMFGGMIKEMGITAPTDAESNSLINAAREHMTGARIQAQRNEYAAANEALRPFMLTPEDLSGVASDIGPTAAPTQAAIDAEVKRMAAAGEINDISAVTPSELKQATDNLTRGAATATTEDTSIADRMQNIFMKSKEPGGISIADAIDLANPTPQLVRDNASMGAFWDAIKSAIGDNPAGLKALQDRLNAETTAIRNEAGRNLVSVMNGARAAEGGHNIWQRLVNDVLAQMKDPASVEALRNIFPTEFQFKQFQQMLNKKALYDAMQAYRNKMEGRIPTLQVAHNAAEAFNKSIQDFLKKSPEGLIDPQMRTYFASMGKGIPDPLVIAKNFGIDLPGHAIAQTGAAAAKDLEMIRTSPLGAAIQDALVKGNYEGIPAAILSPKMGVEQLQALRRSLSNKQGLYETLMTSTLGHMIEPIRGLAANLDRGITGAGKGVTPEEIDRLAQDFGIQLRGNAAKFKEMFDAQVKDPVTGKTISVAGDSILENLSNFSNIMASGKDVRRAAGKAIRGLTFAAIHHLYIASVLLGRSAQDVLGKETNFAIKDLATKTARQMTSTIAEEYASAAESASAVAMAKGKTLHGVSKTFQQSRSALAWVYNRIVQLSAPIVKYEIASDLAPHVAGVAAPIAGGIAATQASNVASAAAGSGNP